MVRKLLKGGMGGREGGRVEGNCWERGAFRGISPSTQNHAYHNGQQSHVEDISLY